MEQQQLLQVVVVEVFVLVKVDRVELVVVERVVKIMLLLLMEQLIRVVELVVVEENAHLA
tara:strand:+ start:359 stop:538 length:180 start_codon:yes stop_codon:yes gene_type:complete